MVGISGQALKDGRYVMSGVNEKHKIKDKKQGIKTKREKKDKTKQIDFPYQVKQATLTGGFANFFRTTPGLDSWGCVTPLS